MPPRFNGHVSLSRAAEITGGYPLLVRNLAERDGIPIESTDDGAWYFIAVEQIDRLRELVQAHKNRPRLRRMTAS